MAGYIRRRSKGSWEVTVHLGHDPSTGRVRRRFLAVKGTKRDAESALAEALHERDTGIDISPGKITVADYLRRWLEAVCPNLAPATYRRYEGFIRAQIVPIIGALPLAKLRPLHVQQLYACLQESGRADGRGGLAPRTLLHVHRVLSEALAQAVRWQIVARNVCQAVEAPQARRTEIRALSPEETRRLLEVAEVKNTSYGDTVILAVHTGLRLGELLGLRWEDVDLERGTVTVRRTLQRLPGEGIGYREPKTARSQRTMPLGSTALETLRRLRRRQLEERLALGPAYQDRGAVLSTTLGTPLDGGNLRRAFYRLVRQAGLTALRFHDLRHTHASLLLARGVHPKVVSERLGHASIAITLDTYSHVLPNLQEEAAHDLDAWLSGRA